MLTALLMNAGAVPRSRETTPPAPDLVDWLRSGRLTLVDDARQAVGLERWPTLPAEVRARALEDFQRTVRGNTKAAVMFLREAVTD